MRSSAENGRSAAGRPVRKAYSPAYDGRRRRCSPRLGSCCPRKSGWWSCQRTARWRLSPGSPWRTWPPIRSLPSTPFPAPRRPTCGRRRPRPFATIEVTNTDEWFIAIALGEGVGSPRRPLQATTRTVPNQCPGVHIESSSWYCAHPERCWMRWSPAFAVVPFGGVHRVHVRDGGRVPQPCLPGRAWTVRCPAHHSGDAGAVPSVAGSGARGRVARSRWRRHRDGTSFVRRGEGLAPVLVAPHRGVGRIDGDDRQVHLGGHGDQPGFELAGGDAGDELPSARTHRSASHRSRHCSTVSWAAWRL